MYIMDQHVDGAQCDIVSLDGFVEPIRCAPLQQYRATLCTIDLRCAPPTCVVHHDAQAGPNNYLAL